GSATDAVYLTLRQDRLLHIPSFTLAAEFGATAYTILPDESLSANQRVSGKLTPVVACGDTRYIAANGVLRRISGSGSGGFSPVTLAAAECDAFTLSSETVSEPLFVQPRGRDEIYVVRDGQLRHVQSGSDLVGLNGTRPLTVLSWSTDTAQAVGIGSGYLPEGSFVQFQGKDEIYRFTGERLHHVRSATTLI